MLRIEEIKLPESVAADYDADNPFNSLRDIRRLNAFVGPNNSGKSRLMRAMFLAGANLMISTDDEDARAVRQGVRQSIVTAPGLSNHRSSACRSCEPYALASCVAHKRPRLAPSAHLAVQPPSTVSMLPVM